MIIINNSNKTYLCTMTISVIKTAIKEKKNKTRSHFNLNTMKAILFIYIYMGQLRINVFKTALNF